MYLANLSNEQKELFLDLSMFSMQSHDAIDGREKMMVRQYCEEMKIGYREKQKNSSAEEVLEKLDAISDYTVKKKITVELLAIMYADEELQDEENELLLSLKEIFGFNSNLMEELIFTTRHLLLSYRMLQNVVNKRKGTENSQVI